MALNRKEILSLNVNDSLVEEYLIELMNVKHQAATHKKQLEAALTANDELHAEVNDLRSQLEEPAVEGEVIEHDPEQD